MSGANDTNGVQVAAPVADHGAPADNTGHFDTDFIDMFRHDPFSNNQGNHKPAAQPAAPAAPVPDAGVQASQPNGTQPTAAPTVDPKAVTAPASTPTPDPNAIAMRDTAAALAAATQNLQTGQQPATAEPVDQTMDYRFNVPPQLAAALNAEDPNIRVQALAHMQAAITAEAHRRIRAEMTAYAETQVPAMIQSMFRAHTFRETVKNDFYGKYPQLNKPALAQLVAGVTSEVLSAQAQAGQNITWNEGLRDEIANRIFQIIPQLRGHLAPAAPPAPNAPQVPPRMFNGGARPAPAQGVQQDIIDTLFSN